MRIVQAMPPAAARQTFMFSATFPTEIQKLAREFMRPYVWIGVGRVGSTVEGIEQRVWLAAADKRAKLAQVVKALAERGGRTLIFVEKKRSAVASHIPAPPFPPSARQLSYTFCSSACTPSAPSTPVLPAPYPRTCPLHLLPAPRAPQLSARLFCRSATWLKKMLRNGGASDAPTNGRFAPVAPEDIHGDRSQVRSSVRSSLVASRSHIARISSASRVSPRTSNETARRRSARLPCTSHLATFKR